MNPIIIIVILSLISAGTAIAIKQQQDNEYKPIIEEKPIRINNPIIKNDTKIENIPVINNKVTINESNPLIINLRDFLKNDITNRKPYLPYYTCGHYSRETAKNAAKENIILGSIIVSDHPTLQGHNNHIMNYITIDDEIIVIEPQTDRLMTLKETRRKYYRLYPDGTQVPTYWKNNLAPTGKIE
ncbi:MAG: hypothetical protein KAI81_04440 [Candidatus Marinimicrobia bacterium]|nr:hypothetical protein [Candidatus Neomarinimicrobiota bacterium]